MNNQERIIFEKLALSLKACELHISRINYAVSDIGIIFA